MAKATVLYVEDEASDALFMTRAFQKKGFDHMLKVVPTGRRALDYLAGRAPYEDREAHPLPSVILLDLNLPGMSGFEVLGWLGKQSELRNLPVLVFSSSVHPADIARAKQLGANDYFEKPSSGLEFVGVVDQLERWLLARDGQNEAR